MKQENKYFDAIGEGFIRREAAPPSAHTALQAPLVCGHLSHNLSINVQLYSWISPLLLYVKNFIARGQISNTLVEV